MARISRAQRGRKLAAVRSRLDLTQADVADGSGLTVQTISRMETGALPITDSALVKLARGLNSMSLDALANELDISTASLARSA